MAIVHVQSLATMVAELVWVNAIVNVNLLYKFLKFKTNISFPPLAHAEKRGFQYVPQSWRFTAREYPLLPQRVLLLNFWTIINTLQSVLPRQVPLSVLVILPCELFP
jgi:hypothetical protein